MLSDYTVDIGAVPPDAYALKRSVYQRLDEVGLPVDGRRFVYSLCPIVGSVIVRSPDERLSRISLDCTPVIQPKVGIAYDFCLRASPMHQPLDPHWRTRDRRLGHPVKKPTEPQNWLNRHIDGLGIELLACHHRAGWVWCGKPSKTGNGFFIPAVVYLGRLAVRDQDKLTSALANGVGRHRAFGFGLLQLYEE